MSNLLQAAPKAVQAARFVGSVYWQRAQIVYWARVRGDLFSRLNLPSDHTDPYLLYEQLRAQGPMVRTRLGNYSTTSHRLCREVLRSRDFGVVPNDGTADVAHQQALDLSLLTLNPPDHSRIRRLAAPAFTPRRIAAYQTLVDDAVDRLLDECERRGRFDLVADFASPLPIAVITRLLGLPDEPALFRRLGATIAEALDGIWSLRQAKLLAAADAELRALFDDLLARRAREPGDDLVSVLVNEHGTDLTGAELAALARLLLIAGFETTVNAIGSGMRWLLAFPAQWRLLTEDPRLAGQAAEEVLRYDPPVQQTARVSHVDQELGGVRLAPNQWVITLLAAANRDPEVFERPGSFEITRTGSAEHLSFSAGIHYCLGAPLARMELVRALAALARRMPDLRPDGELVMRPGTTLRGPRRFPVALG